MSAETDLLSDLQVLMRYLAHAQTTRCGCGRPIRADLPAEVREIALRVAERMGEWRKAVAEAEDQWPKNIEVSDEDVP